MLERAAPKRDLLDLAARERDPPEAAEVRLTGHKVSSVSGQDDPVQIQPVRPRDALLREGDPRLKHQRVTGRPEQQRDKGVRYVGLAAGTERDVVDTRRSRTHIQGASNERLLSS